MLNAIRLSKTTCRKAHSPLARGILITVMVFTIGLQLYFTHRGVTTGDKEPLFMPILLIMTGILLPLLAIVKTKKAEGPEASNV